MYGFGLDMRGLGLEIYETTPLFDVSFDEINWNFVVKKLGHWAAKTA